MNPRTSQRESADAVTSDPSVAEWLRRFDRATAALPDEQAAELRDDIVEHLRAQPVGGLSDAIARLGVPEDVADEALATGRDEPGGAGSSATPRPATVGPGPRVTGSEVLAVLVTVLGGVVVPVLGWFGGLALLWTRGRWTVAERLTMTLIVPGGLLPAVALLALPIGLGLDGRSCRAGGDVYVDGQLREICTAVTPWWQLALGWVVIAGLTLAPIITGYALLRRVSHRPAPLPQPQTRLV